VIEIFTTTNCRRRFKIQQLLKEDRLGLLQLQLIFICHL